MKYLACAGIAVLATAQLATAQEMLANPGFENGLVGWTTFGNVFPEAANPPAIVPRTGNGVAKMFGGFSGGFNVGGMFQEFPAAPGQSWTMDVFSRHFSGDAMVGAGAPNDNWAVMKLAFFDAGNTEIGFAERTVLNGTFATDVWIDNLPITGIAPANTIKVQAFLLYLQPAFAGGAAQFDDASVIPAPGMTLPLAAIGFFARRRRR